MIRCTQCGASGEVSCREKFEEMLALEFEDPSIFGAAHHITVICYNLQHPDYFTEEALTWMRSSLHAVIIDGMTPAELREQNRKSVKQGMTVRRRTEAETVPIKTQWSMTVLDVRTDSAEAYIEDIWAWAKAILKDLEPET